MASGSSGNATFIASARTRLLVDVGLARREIESRLAAIGEDPEKLDAVLITHEHNDHVSGLLRWVRRFGTPVFMTHLAASAIDWQGTRPRLETFQSGGGLRIGDMDIQSFTIPHDAIDPVGFRFRVEGVTLGLVTDLGYIPESIKHHLRGSDLLVLESNHDLEMLRVGPYPWAVKQRVMSRNGHLSNDSVGDYIRNELDAGVETLILSHLSENNNHPELARLVARQALDSRRHRARLVVAEPRKQSEVFLY